MHRTSAGGVKVDLRTPREVAEGYRMLVAASGSGCSGCWSSRCSKAASR